MQVRGVHPNIRHVDHFRERRILVGRRRRAGGQVESRIPVPDSPRESHSPLTSGFPSVIPTSDISADPLFLSSQVCEAGVGGWEGGNCSVKSTEHARSHQNDPHAYSPPCLQVRDRAPARSLALVKDPTTCWCFMSDEKRSISHFDSAALNIHKILK